MKTIKSVISTMLTVLLTTGTMLISQPTFAATGYSDAADGIPDSSRICLSSVDYESMTAEELEEDNNRD